MEAIDWIARQIAEKAAEGRKVLAVELDGTSRFAGRRAPRQVRPDRPPARRHAGDRRLQDRPAAQPRAVRAGYSLQLGLLGLIAERGGFEDIEGVAPRVRILVAARARPATASAIIDSPVDPEGKRDRSRPPISSPSRRAISGSGTQLADRRRAVHRQAPPRICALCRV
jgi:ATP-dependent helicase/nuclease subunit B